MPATAWLREQELRIGLGCMRLSTDDDRDEERSLATIATAAGAGVTVFDTARAYGRGEGELGHNERLLARALPACGAEATARVVTKGGMSRPGGAWVPDGRAKAIRADCEASLGALDGLPIDLYLLHAPDPRTPWRTSLRALARLRDEGLVRRVGVANLNLAQLDEALAVAGVEAVQLELSPFDDRALRGGLVERCVDAGVALIAHSPLGGLRRAGSLGRREALAGLAATFGATPAELALAWLLGLAPNVVAIPGARRPETAASAARAATLELAAAKREALAREFGSVRPAPRRARAGGGEVVVVMGIPGAGKSRAARAYVERGYLRLNRDERGGSLRDLAAALDDALATGAAARIALDNTYLTRASRSHVLDSARRHGARTRCVWLDTPLPQAQVNLVERLLDRFGSLPEPGELRALSRREAGVLAPTSQLRAVRELEPPNPDEGFDEVEQLTFARVAHPERTRPGVFVTAAALRQAGWEEAIEAGNAAAPHLVFDWSREPPAAEGARLGAVVAGPVEAASCPHADGPPSCWCRPPLPGLPLAFARTHGVDPRRSLLVGTGHAHRALAAALGARYVELTRAPSPAR